MADGTMCRQQRREQQRQDVKRHGAVWTPFEQVARDRVALVGNLDAVARQFGVPIEAVREVAEQVHAGTVLWTNSLYQVQVKPAQQPAGWLHLIIRRRDNGATIPWRDRQRLKNELVGPECEGIELHPAESRLLDRDNAFHLFVCPDPNERLEAGFHSGRQVATTMQQGG